MEFISIQMVIIILVIGIKIYFMDTEYIYLHLQVRDMKENFIMVKSMEKVNIIIKKVIFMKGSGEMIKKMALGNFSIIKQMIDMRENGKKVKEMVKENFIII